jgi:hypothetical protein
MFARLQVIVVDSFAGGYVQHAVISAYRAKATCICSLYNVIMYCYRIQ